MSFRSLCDIHQFLNELASLRSVVFYKNIMPYFRLQIRFSPVVLKLPWNKSFYLLMLYCASELNQNCINVFVGT